MTMAPCLEVQDLTKGFTLHMLGGKRLMAFADVHFTLDPSECLQVEGPSGVGKSSLLKCLYRTYRPSHGQAVFRTNGRWVDLASAPDSDILDLRRRAIGYVSQFFSAIPRQSAVAVVAEPLLVLGLDAPTARRRAQAMLARLDIPKSLWEGFPATFSGGERQRVNLARAFIAPRELILLDEPTASLDAARREIVFSLLAELKRAGTALIAVFHDAVPAALIDRSLRLKEAES